MTKRIDPEILVAFVDGQLDPKAMAETAEHLMQDPDAMARVRALHGDSALLRAAYQEAADAPLPPALLSTIDRGFAKRQRTGAAFPRYAIAAGLALTLAAGLVGYLVGEYRLRSEMATASAQMAENQRLMAAAIEQALERTTSGNSVAWQNPDSGAYGQVVPVRTYRSKSNHWCREYHASTVVNGTEEKSRAIACRAGDGAWVKVEQLYYDS